MKILGHRVGQKLEIYLNSGTLDNFLTCAACHHCFLASRGATPRCYLRVGCCSAFVLICSLATCRARATSGGLLPLSEDAPRSCCSQILA